MAWLPEAVVQQNDGAPVVAVADAAPHCLVQRAECLLGIPAAAAGVQPRVLGTSSEPNNKALPPTKSRGSSSAASAESASLARDLQGCGIDTLQVTPRPPAEQFALCAPGVSGQQTQRLDSPVVEHLLLLHLPAETEGGRAQTCDICC